MEVRKGYKQTEAGIIPDDWDVKKLGDCLLGKPEYGINAPAIEFSDNFPAYIRITDITEDGKFSSEKMASVDIKGSDKYFLDKGDLVFARTGASVGKTYLYNPKDGALVFAGFLIRVKPNTSKLLPEFLAGCVTTKRYWNWVQLMSMRSGQPGINGNEYSKFLIPLPSLPEQKAIAAALSDVDSLLTSLDTLIAKKRLIKQGAMQELLTGKKRLPGFSGEWNILELKEIVNQFIVPMRDKPKAFKGDIPWCRIEDFDGKILFGSKSNQNVDNETIKQMNLKVYPTGTLLVSCSADLGRCAIVGRPLVSNQTFIGLVFDEGKASNDYFYYYMSYHADDLNNLSSGTTISYLSREQFETFNVTVPSTKAEQTAIAEILSDMDAEIAALETRREKTRLLKQGMMQELLTGRIRLV